MANNAGKVLVTGASGFLGGALVRALTERGIDTVGAVRSTGSVTEPVADVAYVSVGNIDEKTAWEGLLRGTKAVVHCAARVHIMGDGADDPLQAFRAVNRDGTLNLARQAAKAGVSRFVFISTVKVNGEQTDNRPAFQADDVPAPEDPYAISKREAEDGLRALARKTGMEVVIVRPPLVYGPGVKGNFRSLLKLAKLPVPLPLGAVQNQRSLVYLGNLVDFIVCVLQHSEAANRTFLVSDGQDLSTTQLLRILRRAAGCASLLLPVPSTWLWRVGSFLGKEPLVQRLCGSLQLDIGKSRRLLGWSPPFSAQEGLVTTMQAERNG